MKNLVKLFAAMTLVLGLTFCSDDATNPEGTANVNLVTEMPATLVSRALPTGGSIEATTVDSMKVSRVRILLSQVKFFHDKDDFTAEGKVVKTGPYLLTADATGSVLTVANGSLPAGSYNKIKIEFHRFSSSDLAQYQNDPVFRDFATSDRYSAIIEGVTYKGGVEKAFVFNGTSTENLILTYAQVITMAANTTYTVALLIDPEQTFKANGLILDPSDPKNQNDIDNAIKKIIKSFRKK